MFQVQAFPSEGPAVEWEIGPEIVSKRHSRVMVPTIPSIYASRNYSIPRDVERVEVDFMVMACHFKVQHECEQVLNGGHSFVPDVRPNSVVYCTPHLTPIMLTCPHVIE